ncbi:hypothetical protein [Pseudomonas fluorescens]|uniref:hypothetical protein n=1 Tax=Pseudomonas fluorescens TaxID=294 RepID=UPI001914447A|nr:hypothetical protein [Pseudomonas fluorescens]
MNTNLVLGAAMLAGGLRFQEQRHNATAAHFQVTLLRLAAVALVIPAAYSAVISARAPNGFRNDLKIPALRIHSTCNHTTASLQTINHIAHEPTF